MFFVIAACQCRNNCKCLNDMKIPIKERRFLKCQHYLRKMIVCGILKTNQSRKSKIFTKKEEQIVKYLKQPSTSEIALSNNVDTSNPSTPLRGRPDKFGLKCRTFLLPKIYF